jgi:hypothetical protein
VIKSLDEQKILDFEFKGEYKTRNGDRHVIKFSRLVPVNGSLDDFLDGYVDDWEFAITQLDDNIIKEFKRADYNRKKRVIEHSLLCCKNNSFPHYYYTNDLLIVYYTEIKNRLNLVFKRFFRKLVNGLEPLTC